MRRIWIAIGMIIVVALLCTGEQYYVRNAAQKMDALIQEARNDKSAIEELKKFWESHNDILFAISNHTSLDELSASIDQLQPDSREVEQELDKVESANSTYYENQRAIFSNIL